MSNGILERIEQKLDNLNERFEKLIAAVIEEEEAPPTTDLDGQPTPVQNKKDTVL